MKTHLSFLSLLSFVAVVAFAGPDGPAHSHSQQRTPQKEEQSPEWADLFGGASLPLVWQSISAASDKIDAALAAKNVEGVPDWAETIHLGAHALDDQIQLESADRARRLKGAFRQAAKIADDVLNAANHNEIDDAANAQRRLKAALALAKARMPKDILDAPKQEVRFAKAAAHAHGGNGEHTEKHK